MSVSKTNFSDLHIPGSARDDLNSLLPQIPPPTSKRSTGESPSKFSIDALLCSSGTKSDDSQAAKRVADANTSSISILKPSMVPGIPITTPKQPLPMGARQEPLPRDISIPFTFPFSTEIVPTAQHYPSSYPVLKSYPIPPSQTHDSLAIAAQAGFYTMPTTPDQDPTLTPISYGSLVLTQAPFHSAFDFTQPATNIRQSTSLPNMGDEPPAKRRRIGEGSDSTTTNSSRQTAELPIWHESRLETNEDPTPYMEFLGLTDYEGKNFVETIFNSYSSFKNKKERIDFLKKLFTHLSAALEKRQLGTTEISDDQLGKLIVASFILIKKISKYFDSYYKKNKLSINIAELVISFVNKNHCIASYLKWGIQFDDRTSILLFSGQNKRELVLWCAEQDISLNQEELKILSTEKFRTRMPAGPYLLKELRDRVKDQQKNATS